MSGGALSDYMCALESRRTSLEPTFRLVAAITFLGLSWILTLNSALELNIDAMATMRDDAAILCDCALDTEMSGLSTSST